MDMGNITLQKKVYKTVQGKLQLSNSNAEEIKVLNIRLSHGCWKLRGLTEVRAFSRNADKHSTCQHIY